MNCWICFEKTNNIPCKCKGGYKYAHHYCINTMSIIYNKKKCNFCGEIYKISYFYYILFNMYLFIKFISLYDIQNGILWEDYYED